MNSNPPNQTMQLHEASALPGSCEIIHLKPGETTHHPDYFDPNKWTEIDITDRRLPRILAAKICDLIYALTREKKLRKHGSQKMNPLETDRIYRLSISYNKFMKLANTDSNTDPQTYKSRFLRALQYAR